MSISAVEWGHKRRIEIAAEKRIIRKRIELLTADIKERDEQLKALDQELKHLKYFFHLIVPNMSPPDRVTAVDGTVQILRREEKFLNIAEITNALLALGFESNAKNPTESVRATLSGEIQKDSSRVVRLMGFYGLPGWENDPAKVASTASKAAGTQKIEASKLAAAISKAAGTQKIEASELAAAISKAAGTQKIEASELAAAISKAAGTQKIEASKLAAAISKAVGTQKIEASKLAAAISKAQALSHPLPPVVTSPKS